MTIVFARPRLACLVWVPVLVSLAVPAAVLAATVPDATLKRVVANDNRRAAGTFEAGILNLALRAGRGTWRPEGPSGPALSIEAFGETSGTLMVPAPMIRVIEGTRIVVSIRNDLASPLTVHGLCARDGAACPPLAVPAGEVRRAEFDAGRPGTYHYWATSMGAPIPFREMAGAFIVDPRDAPAVPDRVLVITEWTDLTPEQLRSVMQADDPGKAFAEINPRLTFVMNGLSWPATERLTYRLGEQARWRVINLSSQHHPMHLHGFYFEVDSLGDGLADRQIPAADRQRVVTQVLRSGSTMTMTWVPEREGNWLFHCHIMHHVSPERRLATPAKPAGDGHGDHGSHDPGAGMAGMIIGVIVTKPPAPASPVMPPRAPRKLTLVMGRVPRAEGPSFGFALSGDGIAASAGADRIASPGPALVLKRDEPVEITVVNQLGERTALHWHGMELDSIYDGVHGWSGAQGRVAPAIEPDGTFVVRFTPPRNGTFMYHTHVHDERQLPLGLYGPMIVVDAGDTFDTATDHVLIVGRQGLDPAAPNVLIPVTPVVLNGETSPEYVWEAGQRHRVRLINITPGDIVTVSLQGADGPVKWTPVTKDGAPVPAGARLPVAARQTIAVGETYDFEVTTARAPQHLWVEVRSPAGKWLSQGHVIVK